MCVFFLFCRATVKAATLLPPSSSLGWKSLANGMRCLVKRRARRPTTNSPEARSPGFERVGPSLPRRARRPGTGGDRSGGRPRFLAETPQIAMSSVVFGSSRSQATALRRIKNVASTASVTHAPRNCSVTWAI